MASDLGLVLSSVTFHSHRRPPALIVEIRRSDGSDVLMEDCERFSRCFDARLEQEETLSHTYLLEVTSPGIGEDLVDDRDFRSFRGFPVTVSCCRDNGSETTLAGTLIGRDETHVQLNRKGRISRIPRDAVQTVRLSTAAE